MVDASSVDALFNCRSAVVLGGTGGLGKSVCLVLAESGLDVHFSYYANEAKAEALAAAIRGFGRKASFRKVDLAHAADVAAFVSGIAGENLGVAVYAAGLEIGNELVSELSLDRWNDIVHSDVDGFFAFASTVAKSFRARGGGSLVAITTVATVRTGSNRALSSVPKAAIEKLVKAIAAEDARYNIRANCVAPGPITAGIGERMRVGQTAAQEAASLARIPLGRYSDARDVAEAVLFLASTRARSTTGVTLFVDGGRHL